MRSIVVLGIALAVLCGLWNGSAMNQSPQKGLNANNMAPGGTLTGS